jgi:hypothetical protein
MPITLSNSQIRTFQMCKREFYYKVDKKLVSKRVSLPMYRGTWLHSLLEAHYTKEGGWKRELNKVLKPQYMKLFEEEREFYGDLPAICESIMEGYEYHWREEDSGLTIIAAEQELVVPLPHGHSLAFKFDMIAEDEYGRWLVEHKSHKTIPDDDYRFMDIQTARYVWGLNKLGTYGHIEGVLWNYIRTKPPTKPPQLKRGGISLAKKYDTDALTFTKAVVEYGLNPRDFRDRILALKHHNNFLKRVRVPWHGKVVKTIVREAMEVMDEVERGYKPTRNIGRHCGWCSYQTLCMTQLYGGDADQVRRDIFKVGTKEDYYAIEHQEIG